MFVLLVASLCGHASETYRPVPRYQRMHATEAQTRSYWPGTYPAQFLSLSRIPPAKDQGTASTCWAFATMASLESSLLPAERFDFSENNLITRHGFDMKPYTQGGNRNVAAAYLTRWDGPILESFDPYASARKRRVGTRPPVRHVQNVLFLPERRGFQDNAALKDAVQRYGAVAVTIDMTHPTRAVAMNPMTNAYYDNVETAPDHMVNIVGWDDHYNRKNFRIPPPGDGAFIIRNTLRPSYEDNGFVGTFWAIVRGAKRSLQRAADRYRAVAANFGFTAPATTEKTASELTLDDGYCYVSYYCRDFPGSGTVFLSEPSTNYRQVYQYDPFGMCAEDYYPNRPTVWTSNIFTANATDHLAAVGFYTLGVAYRYEIRVYLRPDIGPVSTAGAVFTQRGSSIDAGYHTIRLAKSIPIAAGQRFSVVVKTTNPTGEPAIFPLEETIRYYSSRATANAGESFISLDGVRWAPLTPDNDGVGAYANACIKAYTSGEYAAAPHDDH